jgi:DNA-binding MarR family transcriptional regulator
MNSPPDSQLERAEQLDYVATHLITRAGLLVRLLVRGLAGDLSRTDVGLLRTLDDGPRRITELAELEGLAQPTITLLVKRLEERGLVRRERDPDDGRVVLVSVTAEGTAALEEARGELKGALRRYVAAMSDEQLQALADSTETLGELIETIQHGVGR